MNIFAKYFAHSLHHRDKRDCEIIERTSRYISLNFDVDNKSIDERADNEENVRTTR